MSIKTANQLCIKTCDFRQRPLIFVRRDVNYCNAVAIPLPSLGVSSLDLGRLPTRAALFLAIRPPADGSLFRSRPIGPQLLQRDLAEAPRQRLQVGGQAG